jgi:hypothetical protein
MALYVIVDALPGASVPFGTNARNPAEFFDNKLMIGTRLGATVPASS